MTDKLTATMQIAKRVYSLAQEQNDPALMIGAYSRFGRHALLFGRFRVRATIRDAWLFRSGAREAFSLIRKSLIRQSSPVCAMRHYPSGISERSPLANATMAEAISLAKELNDINALAMALCFGSGTRGK